MVEHIPVHTATSMLDTPAVRGLLAASIKVQQATTIRPDRPNHNNCLSWSRLFGWILFWSHTCLIMKRVLLATTGASQHLFLRQFALRSSLRSVSCKLGVARTTTACPCYGSRMWLSSGSNVEGEAVNDAGTTVAEREDGASPPESTLNAEERSIYTVPIEIRMPDMSDGHDNTVETWYKKPGDVIKYNDILCDIATQDFTFGLSMDDDHDAIMGEIHVEAGTSARDGAPICTVYHPEDESGGKKK